jgi:hypothetical protein
MDIWKTTALVALGIFIGALGFNSTAEATAPSAQGHSFTMHMDSQGRHCYYGMGSIKNPTCQCPEGYTWAGWTKVQLTKEDNLEAICLRR